MHRMSTISSTIRPVPREVTKLDVLEAPVRGIYSAANIMIIV
jgi:hypothetical protein